MFGQLISIYLVQLLATVRHIYRVINNKMCAKCIVIYALDILSDEIIQLINQMDSVCSNAIIYEWITAANIHLIY